MFAYSDIFFQLVDLPPISPTYMESWMPNALQPARAALLVVDLSVPGYVEQVTAIKERLDQKRITLVERWPGTIEAGDLDVAGAPPKESKPAADPTHEETFELDDPFRTYLSTLLIANKSDLEWDRDEIAVLRELVGAAYPALAVSAKTGWGLDRVGHILFGGLGIVRVYTKAPGRPPDKDRPFTVFKGNTILDVAELVHRDLAFSLKYARVWGSGKFEGQRVGKDHVVSDGDIVELHG